MHELPRRAPRPPTVVAASTTAEALTITQGYISVCAVGGALTLRFGTSDVGAAAITDWPLAQGEKERFFITPATAFVSIQGAGSLAYVVD